VATGEYRRLVTRTESPELVNSTAPAVDAAPNDDKIMSSNARDSRAPSTNVTCGAVPGHAPTKHRYTAVTDTDDVYDVLNTRTSEKNGLAAAPSGNDATAGSVNVSAKSDGARRSTSEAAGRIRRARPMLDPVIVFIEPESMGGTPRRAFP
jgi:hypothetical protein